CSFAQIERTVAQAIDLFDPEEAEKRRKKAADDRDFQVHLGQRNSPTDGTVDVTGTLSVEDALDLEAAVRQGAKALGDLGCEESLGARRSMAVGEMARQQLTLDLESGGDTGGRGVVIYAHLDADSPHVSLDNIGGGDVLIDQLKAWCQTAGTTVTIKPVIDLNQEISTNAYVPTAKLVEQVRLRDQNCVFPNCTRRAEHCDLDHRVPFNKKDPSAGGQTTTSNLSLLCRKHHRAKTFSTWAYDSPHPGVYDWTSPSGARFRVTRGRRHGRMPITTPLDDPPEP
ncbi:HNH endonuclease signature motif containing protein, partial [Nocardioides sp.]|uniref:HNH endonuclease signature motif containing protein n=1 Tax=Nocardioides sp. TaxID=35761 RepID=UPI002B26E99F